LSNFAVCLFLALAVWGVFGQTLHHSFVFDDRGYVYENPAITEGLHWKGVVWAFTHSHGGNWHPLTTLSHMLDCQLFGLNPRGHHLTNVLLHTASVLLLFLVLRKMTGALWRSGFVAVVFAIHPLAVESVAWVAERKDVLSGLFFMLTLWAYLRYTQKQAAHSQSFFSFVLSPAYWLALLLFALGLMSKPMLVTLPFVLLLLDYWPLRRFAMDDSRFTIGRLACEKIPFLLLTAADSIATVWAQHGAHAIMSGQVLDVRSRMGNALISYAAYLGQIIYPAGLVVLYPHPGNRLSVWRVGLSLLVLIFISAGVLLGRRKWPYVVVGWLWYLGMLVPVIGLVQVGVQARADRYAYLPQIGLYLLMAWGLADLMRGWRGRNVVLGIAGGLAVGGLLVAARAQTAYWKDNIRLWRHAVDVNAHNALVHDSLGVALGDQGQIDEAIRQFHEAIRLVPDHAEFHFNLGIALAQQGKLAEAIQHFEQALRLKPDYADANDGLGAALAQQGKLADAIQHFERALQLRPDFPDALNNLGTALAQQGKLADAISNYERALQLRPDLPEVHNTLGLLLAQQGKLAEAIQHFERAIQLEPDDARAYNNLAAALVRQGNSAEALPHFQKALNLATAQNNAPLAEAIRTKLRSFQPASPQRQTP
jgi:Flp pilus assembly protein TadD